MHVDVSRAYFYAKAQRLVLVKFAVEDCSGKDKGKINWERDWQGHLEKLGIRAGAQFKKFVS